MVPVRYERKHRPARAIRKSCHGQCGEGGVGQESLRQPGRSESPDDDVKGAEKPIRLVRGQQQVDPGGRVKNLRARVREQRLAKGALAVEEREFASGHLLNHRLRLRRPDHAYVAQKKSSIANQRPREIQQWHEAEDSEKQEIAPGV